MRFIACTSSATAAIPRGNRVVFATISPEGSRSVLAQQESMLTVV